MGDDAADMELETPCIHVASRFAGAENRLLPSSSANCTTSLYRGSDGWHAGSPTSSWRDTLLFSPSFTTPGAAASCPAPVATASQRSACKCMRQLFVGAMRGSEDRCAHDLVPLALPRPRFISSVYIYVHIYIYIYTYIYVCMYIITNKNVFTYMNTFSLAYPDSSDRKRNILRNIYVHIYMYVYRYVYVYIHTRAHTHKHTSTCAGSCIRILQIEKGTQCVNKSVYISIYI